jgi:type IV pilus assembly protein PilA
MIVIAIIAILAAIAIPNLIASRMSSNEASAIATLRAICAAQTLFNERDTNHNGYGDYATAIVDLQGLLDSTLTNPQGEMVYSTPASVKAGYRFAVLQPMGDSRFQWHAIAVPVRWGRSGERAFYINESCAIKFTNIEVLPEGSPGMVAFYTASWPAVE